MLHDRRSSRLFHRIRPIWFWLLLSALILILLFLGRPDALLFPSIYFEDSTTYYAEQLHSGSALTIFKPFFLGYYVLVPRLLAYLVWRLRSSRAPYLFNLSGFRPGTAACTFFCLPRFRQIIASPALCVLFAVTLDSTEAFATATNCS